MPDSPPPTSPTCAAGTRCTLRQPEYAPDSTVRVGWQPATLTDAADGLCAADTGRLLYTLGEMPELVARLHVAHLPNLSVRYRQVEYTDGTENLPIPLSEHADALIRLLDHEIHNWADAVADQAGLTETGEWQPDMWDRMRVGVRIVQGCELLHYRHAQWLAHPLMEYRARTAGSHRVHGLDDERVTFNGRDAWITRSGAEAAAHLLDIAQQARGFTVPQGSDWVPIPCGRCGGRRLHRHHQDRCVVCYGCGRVTTDDQHDSFLAAALGEDRPAREERTGPVWLPEACMVCGHHSMWLDDLAGPQCRCTARAGRGGRCCTPVPREPWEGLAGAAVEAAVGC